MLMVFSTAPTLAFKQILAWIIGIAWFWWGRHFNYKISRQLKISIFAGSCFLLLLPMVLGGSIRGSNRWISFGPASFQPTELVKPWLMLFLSNTMHPELILIPTIITALQPDLSSAIAILLLAIPCIFYDKRLLKLTIWALVIMALISPLIWQFGLKQYQRDRVASFINPTADTSNKGYNVIQSQIAIGSGGILGKGYKKGTQNQLRFLPEKHTDFIFASIAEELGLVGVFILITSYYLLIRSILSRFAESTSKYQKIFILGILFHIWSQVVANIGMNLGILPVSGLPLPFISVGGSAIMSLLFSLGIIYAK